jgi:hypothetical protein
MSFSFAKYPENREGASETMSKVPGKRMRNTVVQNAPAAIIAPSFFELRYYHMRNSKNDQVRRTTDFIANGYLPGARRAGIGPIGIFDGVIAQDSPFLLVLSTWPSLAAMQTSLEKLSADAGYQKLCSTYNERSGLPYIRMESALYRCFSSMPVVGNGTLPAGKAPGIFELRTYESDNEATLRTKIGMFADGEISIFRTSGLHPVFFGEALVGPKLPCLTYMLAYKNMAAREKAWAAFIADPEWQRLSGRSGLSDPDIVANISNAILKPVAGSEIC